LIGHTVDHVEWVVVVDGTETANPDLGSSAGCAVVDDLDASGFTLKCFNGAGGRLLFQVGNIHNGYRPCEVAHTLGGVSRHDNLVQQSLSGFQTDCIGGTGAVHHELLRSKANITHLNNLAGIYIER